MLHSNVLAGRSSFGNLSVDVKQMAILVIPCTLDFWYCLRRFNVFKILALLQYFDTSDEETLALFILKEKYSLPQIVSIHQLSLWPAERVVVNKQER